MTYRGDGGPAAKAIFNRPTAVAAAKDGSIYVADTDNHRSRRIDGSGIVRLVAGTGEPGFRGDGGPATDAALRSPGGVAAGADGSVFIADTGNHRIRQVLPDGTIRTIAGEGHPRFAGDGGPATAASLNAPTWLATDAAGNLYLLDSANYRIRRVDTAGVITTVAGADPLGDYGGGYSDTWSDAEHLRPSTFGVAPDGTVYLSDNQNIWRVDPDGTMRRWLRLGQSETALESPVSVDKLAVEAAAVAVGADGTVYLSTFTQLIAIRDNTARKVGESFRIGRLDPFTADPDTGDLIVSFQDPRQIVRQRLNGARSTIWSMAEAAPPSSDPLQSKFGHLQSVAVAPDGTIYVADSFPNRIYAISPNGRMRPVAGSTDPRADSQDGQPALSTLLAYTTGLAVDSKGTLYFAEPNRQRIRKIAADGTIQTVTNSVFQPVWARFDGQDRLYTFSANRSFSRIYRIEADGRATALTGSSSLGYWDLASWAYPPGMAVAKDGTIYAGLQTSYAGTSSIAKLAPGGNLEVVPMDSKPGVSALAIDGAGTLFGAGGGLIQVTTDGRVVAMRRETFSGEFGFDSEPEMSSTASDVALDGKGGLLVIDGNGLRRIALSCVAPRELTITAIAESFTSNTSLALAPGQLISLYGKDIGPADAVVGAPDDTGHYPTQLGGSQVFIDGLPAPLLYAGATQINAVVPFDVDGQTGSVPVEVVRNGIRGSSSRWLRHTGPALLSYVGAQSDYFVRMLNADGTINDAAHPAKLGSVVTLFATGLGLTSPAGEDGKVADANLKRPSHPVSVRVESQDAEILYAGTAPGIVEGVTQINVLLPKALPGRGGDQAYIGVGVVDRAPQPNRLLFYFAP